MSAVQLAALNGHKDIWCFLVHCNCRNHSASSYHCAIVSDV